jgi:hypothetical protein
MLTAAMFRATRLIVRAALGRQTPASNSWRSIWYLPLKLRGDEEAVGRKLRRAESIGAMPVDID